MKQNVMMDCHASVKLLLQVDNLHSHVKKSKTNIGKHDFPFQQKRIHLKLNL